MTFKEGYSYRKVYDIERWVRRYATIRKEAAKRTLNFNPNLPIMWYEFGLWRDWIVFDFKLNCYWVAKKFPWYNREHVNHFWKMHGGIR